LPDQKGRQVSLADLLKPVGKPGGNVNGVLLIFYRGYW